MSSARPSTYQVRNTPYYQRLFRNSLRSGQLERMREEYEQLQEINERTIEYRIRQLRLSRLFREIEEIKQRSSRKSLASSRPVSKTHVEVRAEQLAQARELGKKYSRYNGLSRSNYAIPSVSSMHGDRVKSRDLIQKRISYGNTKSLENRDKVDKIPAIPRRRQEWSKGVLRNVSSIELNKQEMLKSRIDYGNSCSYLNSKRILKKKMDSSLHRDFSRRSNTSRRSSIVSENGEKLSSNSSPNESQTVLNIQTYYTISQHGIEKTSAPFSKEIKDDRSPHSAIEATPSTSDGAKAKNATKVKHDSVRARDNWNKLREHITRLAEESRQDLEGVYYDDEADYDMSSDKDAYRLRTISNDVDLPSSHFSYNNPAQVDCSSLDDADESDDEEQLVRIQSYLEQEIGTSTTLSYEDAQSDNGNLSPPCIPELLKHYEALSLAKEHKPKIPDTHSPVPKSSDSTVNKLREIFEKSR